MRQRAALILLTATWILGLAPAARVTFEASSLESNLFDVAPTMAALLFVTSILFGLASYLRRSAVTVALSALAAAFQWLPVLSVAPLSSALIADYAQLSGIDLSGSKASPETIFIFPIIWLVPLLSAALSAVLVAETRSRCMARGVAASGRAQTTNSAGSQTAMTEQDLWHSQLLESRAKKKENDAR